MEVKETTIMTVTLSLEELKQAVISYARQDPDVSAAIDAGSVEIDFRLKPIHEYMVLPNAVAVTGAEVIITLEE